MSDVNMELIEKMADIALPLSIKFNSKTIKLEELLGHDEAKFRNKAYTIKNFTGKTGRLMLCDHELSTVTIEPDEDGLVMKIENPEIMERLTSAMTYGDLTLTGIAGRADIPVSMIPRIKSGSVIALNCSPEEPAVILIPEIDWVVYKGETVDVDGFFGIRITEAEGYIRKEANGAVVSGDVLLGSMGTNPDYLGSYGIGTIVKFDSPSTNLVFRLTDGSMYRGFLQCFSRDELMKTPELINEIPAGSGDLILCFRNTSITGAEEETAAASPTGPSKSKLTDLSIDSVFSSLSESRIENLLSAMPRNAAIWLLKAAGTEYTIKQLMPLCMGLPEDERGRFLDSFIKCRPSITPKSIGRRLLGRLAASLDKDETEAAEAYTEAFGGFDLAEIDPVKAAAEVFNGYSEHEKRLFTEWLDIADSSALNDIKGYIFLFRDIAALSDRNIQLLLREFDSADLAVALSVIDSNDEIVLAFKRNISERGWKLIEEEISFNKDKTEEQRLEAQDKIIRILSKLEENGSIII